ncbi:hypothetical protein [Planomicrobium sp. MB-3u-38]|uniref:hypothetical protein n=1 Tax=Planomicrobium sp. MB-3u-38 TaxID=2058318 RepID=UPI000C7AB58C|nr:hypothetical protein [Planomicrobium sp. MB-3u-38]PKH08569.1 hypothetical protein CXF70_16510 [Planomicrobium sp. MB-3u-38]
MREDLKGKLDESVPEDVTLSDAKKRQILNAAQSQCETRKPSRVPKLVPALVGVAVIGLSVILGYPYVSDWQEHGAVEEKNLEEPLQVEPLQEEPLQKEPLRKVELPVNDNPQLINAVFYNDNGVFVYQEAQKIFSYNVETKEEVVLTEVPEGTWINGVTVEDDWVAWTEVLEENMDSSSVLNIYNLNTSELITISDLNALSLVIDGDQLSFLDFGSEGPTYKLLDLKTMEETAIYQSIEGADSMQAFNDGIIVIPDIREEQNVTKLTVFDANEKEIINEFEVPSKTTMNIQFDDNKIYAYLADENFVSTLVSIELETGEMTEFDSPEFSVFSVHGKYVALSVAEAGTATVKLFEMDGSSLVMLPALDSVEERLWKPRFMGDGTLVVNSGEEDIGLYLLDTTAID